MRANSIVLTSALLVAVVATACMGGVELTKAPDKPTGDLVFQVNAHTDDAMSAAALGWQTGVPGANLTLKTSDTSSSGLVAVTSNTGVATIRDGAIGVYRAEVTRWLSATERARLQPNDDVLGFSLRRAQVDAQAGTTIPVVLPASRRKDVVISEFSFADADGYQYGGYLELFNNADTTVYLDRMMLARGFDVALDSPNFPCSAYTQITSDSTSIWAREIEAFPGNGRDYPLLPGKTAVFATDAIDHRPLWKHGLDLSNATFESVSGADVDNPAVPNTISRGTFTQQHGLRWFTLANVVVLIRPSDVTSYQKAAVPGSSFEWHRIPAAHILDVLWARSAYVASPYPECPQLVAPRFDRAGADMRESDENVQAGLSISRRVIPELSSLRPVLQHTRTGRADFILTSRTPGTVQ